jgi:hypothetical protein
MLTSEFHCHARIWTSIFHRSRAGLAAAANVSAMRFSRLGVAADPYRGGPAQLKLIYGAHNSK